MEEEKYYVASMRDLKNRLKHVLMQSYFAPNLISDRDKMKELLVSVMADIYEMANELDMEIDEIFKMLEVQGVKKKQTQRMKYHSMELGKFLENGFSVITGAPEEMLKQLEEYIKHAESIWNDAIILYREQRYSTSCFISIVCIEECSKISFGEFQYYHRVLHEDSYRGKKAQGKNPLTKHSRKHFIAACSGALVNTRMDNILGIDEVEAFIQNCESGQLEKIRQMCLYADINREGSVLAPEAIITKDKSLFYVCLAGELLSQILGAESFRRGFQEKLDRFEAEENVHRK